jgi:hypothetical protein
MDDEIEKLRRELVAGVEKIKSQKYVHSISKDSSLNDIKVYMGQIMKSKLRNDKEKEIDRW